MIAQATQVPFIGRRPLLDRLTAMLRKGKMILLQAPGGAGKSMLIAKLGEALPILYAPRCGCLGDFLDDLEPQIDLECGELKIAARVHRLAKKLPQKRRPLIIDNVQRVPPKVAHLIRVLMNGTPVWLVTRSSLPIEMGHVWPYLFAFQRIDVPPFSIEETHSFLAAVPFRGDRKELLNASSRLHRLSAGHPATLAALADELGRHTYDLKTMDGLHLLSLHARITRVEAQLSHA